jgi:DNA-binding Lrp family transcriptional regulator
VILPLAMDEIDRLLLQILQQDATLSASASG